MGLESSDVNDDWIIQNTRQLNEPAAGPNGHNTFQYKITLPSGRTVESEKIREDIDRKGILPAWCENIRGQIVADAEEERAKVRRAVQEKQAAERRAAAEATAQLTQPQSAGAFAGSLPPLPTPALTYGQNYAQSALGGSQHPAAASPVEYAKQMLGAALQQKQHYQMQLMQAQAGLLQAEQAAAMWGQMVAQFEGTAETVTIPQGFYTNPGVIQHARSIVSDGASRKRGRPAGSKNKPKGDDGAFS